MIFRDKEILKELRSIGEKLVSLEYKMELHLGQLNIDLSDSNDMFDNFTENSRKLNMMMNELKGIVSMSRAALAERKKNDK